MLPRTYIKALRAYHEITGEATQRNVYARFAAARSTYHWLAANHGGQWSREYAELLWLGSIYTPGYNERYPDPTVDEDQTEAEICEMLDRA